jgi:hypothetical protein
MFGGKDIVVVANTVYGYGGTIINNNVKGCACSPIPPDFATSSK